MSNAFGYSVLAYLPLTIFTRDTDNVRVTNRMTPEELRSVWPDPCFDREAMVQLLDHDNLEMRKVRVSCDAVPRTSGGQFSNNSIHFELSLPN